MKLTPENVNLVYHECVANKDHVLVGMNKKEVVDFFDNKRSFYIEKLDKHKNDICSLLDQLSESILESTSDGGFQSDFKLDKDKNEWTTNINIVDNLFFLGLAINKVKYLCEKEDFDKLGPYIKELGPIILILQPELKPYRKRKVFDKPVPFETWFKENTPKDEMIYKEGYNSQFRFLKRISKLFSCIDVISTHKSKSILLPVIEITYKGCSIIFRNNFYDYSISIDSKKRIPTHNIIPTDQGKISKCYCEGFIEEWCYDAYTDNSSKFTIQLPNDNYNFYTLLFLIKSDLDEL